jgi:hypothetical protein
MFAVVRWFCVTEIDGINEDDVVDADRTFQELYRMCGADTVPDCPDLTHSTDPDAIKKEWEILHAMAALAAPIGALPRISDSVLHPFLRMVREFGERS